MVYFTYDGTFDGLLSVIFESYRLKSEAGRIVPADRYRESLFDTPVQVETDPQRAERVRRGVDRRTHPGVAHWLYRCFLSEQEDIEMLIYYFVRKAMAATQDISGNYRDERIHRLHRINKQIGREVHRMHAFVRFQLTPDDLYVALVEPDFNVLPLLEDHFRARYPAQEWLIYDARRHYGLLWDRQECRFITFAENDHRQLRQLSADLLGAGETDYQELWKTYFHSVDIPERRNIKLHLQHVPRRYWKYLVEKWDGGGAA